MDSSATALLRLPIIRGVVALVESLTIGFKALGISANAQLPEEEEEISGGDVGRHRSSSRSRSPSACSSSSRSALTSLIKDQLGSAFLFWLVEGVLRTAIFLGYLLAALAPARPAPRVRVPRRRAQDDLLLRGRACR